MFHVVAQSVPGLENLIVVLVHPEVQRKAQMELNAGIGDDRPPVFEDRARLPYVNALCAEVQRWRPALPLALPHMASQNDVYGEYFIPKGSVVVGDAWYYASIRLEMHIVTHAFRVEGQSDLPQRG
jgi:cytochrome P450